MSALHCNLANNGSKHRQVTIKKPHKRSSRQGHVVVCREAKHKHGKHGSGKTNHDGELSTVALREFGPLNGRNDLGEGKDRGQVTGIFGDVCFGFGNVEVSGEEVNVREKRTKGNGFGKSCTANDENLAKGEAGDLFSEGEFSSCHGWLTDVVGIRAV